MASSDFAHSRISYLITVLCLLFTIPIPLLQMGSNDLTKYFGTVREKFYEPLGINVGGWYMFGGSTKSTYAARYRIFEPDGTVVVKQIADIRAGAYPSPYTKANDVIFFGTPANIAMMGYFNYQCANLTPKPLRFNLEVAFVSVQDMYYYKGNPPLERYYKPAYYHFCNP